MSINKSLKYGKEQALGLTDFLVHTRRRKRTKTATAISM
jgi:hypothetical protein